MKTTVKTLDNQSAGEIELKDAVFAVEAKDSAVYEALKNGLANKRQGTHSTLNRDLVSGTTKKPWRQKGTGRARAGSNKSPLWRGAAVIFGPHPRDYRYEIPKKVKQAAWRTALGRLQGAGKLIVIETPKIAAVKTKPFASAVRKLTTKGRVLYVSDMQDKASYENMRKSATNIAWLKVSAVDSVELHDALYTDALVITKAALETLQTRLAGE